MTPPTTAWSTVEQVRGRLRKRWTSGELPRAYLTGQAFTAIRVPIRAPGTADLVDRFDLIREWVAEWTELELREPITLEYRSAGARTIGANRLPCAVSIESWPALCSLLDVSSDIDALNSIREQTRRHPSVASLSDWVDLHPMAALANCTEWPRLIASVDWLIEHRGTERYLREIEVAGVDTKFVEDHRAMVIALVEHITGPPLPDSGARPDLASRLRFRTKPSYVRFRCHGPEVGLPQWIDEITMRAEHFDALDPSLDHVVILENEITYLALPLPPHTAVVFGGGYALPFRNAKWLNRPSTRYWGDLDTHGFAILDQLRQALPAVRSILMDRATLLEHRQRWGTELAPIRRALPHLTNAESELYGDLVSDAYGPHVRLEQERIDFSFATDTLRASRK